VANARHAQSASPVVANGELAAISPKFAEGYARIREVIDHDRASPAWTKALCVACAAAVKGQPTLVVRELTRSRDLGLTREQATGAALAVLISRGEGTYEALATAISLLYPTPVVDAPTSHSFSIDRQGALDHFAGYFGSVPPYIELMADEAPRALEGYTLMREWSMTENVLEPKVIELLFLAINAAEFSSRFVGVHAAGARRAGATEGEIVEAVLCAIPVAGLASWLPAADGIRESRQPRA
jgi:alkylhydroperoxidase/carboxymuconolactone decarboxylase family protein YurZ